MWVRCARTPNIFITSLRQAATLAIDIITLYRHIIRRDKISSFCFSLFWMPLLLSFDECLYTEYDVRAVSTVVVI